MSIELSWAKKSLVLLAAFVAMLFDGFELGLMPVASLSVTQDLLGGSYTASLGGEWFASYTAGLMLGAAVGGIFLGRWAILLEEQGHLVFPLFSTLCLQGLGLL